MKRNLGKIGFLALAATVPVTASAQAALEGQWRNPKGSVVVKVAPCGSSWCGVVVKASDKAKASARRGGTPNLVGTRILTGLHAAGEGRFKGQVFDPKRNIRAPATIKLLGPDALEVKGCAIAGILLCKEQRWTRVG
ncbi:MAG TPA: DUF2147 domain-containing protein [Sphingomicrobium sp.]|nr:DUF2147 domain-containing protein [Sphingomicrobium sp.]